MKPLAISELAQSITKISAKGFKKLAKLSALIAVIVLDNVAAKVMTKINAAVNL